MSYSHQNYPKYKYSEKLAPRIVSSEEEENAMEGAWYDAPYEPIDTNPTDEPAPLIDQKLTPFGFKGNAEPVSNSPVSSEKYVLLSEAKALGIGDAKATWSVERLQTAINKKREVK